MKSKKMSSESHEVNSDEINYDINELVSHQEDTLDHFDTEMASNTLANLRQLRIKQEKLEESSKNFVNKHISRVFVICTGGTLTMVHTSKGYVSQKGFVNRLKVYSNLYDKEFSEQMEC